MPEIVLVRKRNAKTDPPDAERLVLTDLGPGFRDPDGGWFYATGAWMRQMPSWWYDLRPTEGEPLTTEDLRAVLHMLTLDWDDWRKLPAETQNYYNTVSPRLRVALDALAATHLRRRAGGRP